MPQLYEVKKDAPPQTFMDILLAYRAAHPTPRKPRAEMTTEDALKRWPLLSAHMICCSLGYAPPDRAARIVLDAACGRPNYCEWISSCYASDPKPALAGAIKGRHHHKGFMAEIAHAKGLVLDDILHGVDHSRLAAWF